MQRNQLKVYGYQNQMANSILTKSIVRQPKKAFIFTALFPLLFLVNGCRNSSDLKSIQAFATLSNEAAEKFPKIAFDFYGSCARIVRFRPLQERDTAKKSCASTFNAEFETKLNAPHEVLVNYLKALASLAANDTVNFDPELNQLAATFKKAGAPQTQVNAVNGVAKFLFTAATDQYRRKELKKAIQENDASVQTLIKGLQQIVNRNYNLQLAIEAESQRSFYAFNIVKYQPQQPLTAILVDKQWQEEQLALEQKKVAAISYGKLLNQIAQGHGELKKLYDSGEEVNSRQVTRTVLLHAQKIALLLEDLHKAF